MSRLKQDKVNKVFSYRNKSLYKKNYSRKNFNNSKSELVSFIECKFEQTMLSNVKFVNCIFKNCTFSRLEFSRVIFEGVTFVNCTFCNILFNKCIISSVVFEKNNFIKTVIYPTNAKIHGLENNISTEISYDRKKMNKIIEQLRLHKQIRESNTILKKVKRRWPNKVKRELKKISKKEGDKLGLTKKQRLAENARRKKKRNELHSRDYQQSLLGKNRKIDKGIFRFLLSIYTFDELEIGLYYAMEKIDFRFSELSFLLKYIDEGISKNKSEEIPLID